MVGTARMATFALLFAGTVWAQPTPSGAAEAQPTPDVNLNFKQQANLTPQEMLDQGRVDMKRMQEGLQHAVKLQEQTRAQNDLIKLNCVNDKVLQIKASINIGEQSMADLDEAITHSDEGARSHAFSKVTIAGQKVEVLVTEADTCIGQDLAFVGTTNVDIEVDQTIPQEDPTEQPIPRPTVDRPPEASPFI